jgi:hypothetical protein
MSVVIWSMWSAMTQHNASLNQPSLKPLTKLSPIVALHYLKLKAKLALSDQDSL